MLCLYRFLRMVLNSFLHNPLGRVSAFSSVWTVKLAFNEREKYTHRDRELYLSAPQSQSSREGLHWHSPGTRTVTTNHHIFLRSCSHNNHVTGRKREFHWIRVGVRCQAKKTTDVCNSPLRWIVEKQSFSGVSKTLFMQSFLSKFWRF